MTLKISLFFGVEKKTVNEEKLDGVSPVDNRPSTNKLYHFVKKDM